MDDIYYDLKFEYMYKEIQRLNCTNNFLSF